jgi:hypothetical protein
LGTRYSELEAVGVKDLSIKANEYFELKKDPNWHPAIADMKKRYAEESYLIRQAVSRSTNAWAKSHPV